MGHLRHKSEERKRACWAAKEEIASIASFWLWDTPLLSPKPLLVPSLLNLPQTTHEPPTPSQLPGSSSACGEQLSVSVSGFIACDGGTFAQSLGLLQHLVS